MTLRALILLLATGFAGWWSMAWFRGLHVSGDQPAPSAASSVSDTASSSPYARPPAAGSEALSVLAVSLGRLTEPALDGKREEIEQWPPGTARTFALALLDAREGIPGFSFTEINRFQTAAATLEQGWGPQLPHATTSVMGGDWQILSDWVSLDPAAASAAILKMPQGEARATAVDTVAAALAKTDPAAAMELVRQSGEKFRGAGTARAWLALAQKDASASAATARTLTPAQQENLILSLTALVEGGDYDSPGSATMLSDAALRPLAAALSHLPPGPSKKRLVEQIAHRDITPLIDAMTDGDRSSSCDPQTFAVVFAESLVSPDRLPWVLDHIDDLGTGSEHRYFEASATVLNAAAPRLLPQLARSGHLPAAVQLLDRIPDPDVRLASLESILPAWMDADPAAARAAFNAAPLTALEREKWEHRPAFLLHPAYAP